VDPVLAIRFVIFGPSIFFLWFQWKYHTGHGWCVLQIDFMTHVSSVFWWTPGAASVVPGRRVLCCWRMLRPSSRGFSVRGYS